MEPRVINLEAIPPETRAHLLSGLPHAFASKPVRAKGLGIGITLIAVWMIAWWVHTNFVRHEGTKLYGAQTFIIFGLLAWLAAVPIVAFFRMKRSLGRAPMQGAFLIGSNLVVATERTLTIFPFAKHSAVARSGMSVILTCFNQIYSFDFPDGRSFAVEQQVKNNANALVHAQYYGDTQTAMTLDPFSQIAPHAPAKHLLGAWLLALPAIIVSLPIVYGLERVTDTNWYGELYFDATYDYGYQRYLKSNGRHTDEVIEHACKVKMDHATTPPEIHTAMVGCPMQEQNGNDKLDNFYTKTRAQLESLPAKAQPVLLELLDLSRKGLVEAKFVVHAPAMADLLAIDKLLDKSKMSSVVHLGTNFDPAGLKTRETQLRDVVINAINGLASDAFHIEDAAEKPSNFTIEMTYTLTPLLQGDNVIVYRETALDSAGRRFLGLNIHIDLTLQTAKGTKYALSLDAEPPARIDTDQYATTKSIYNNLVDAAIGDVTKQLKAKMFKP